MGDIQSRLNKTAIKKGTTWDTEVDVNAAGNGLLCLNPGVPKAAVEMIQDDAPTTYEKNLTVGNYPPVDFSLDFDYRWDGLENILLAMLLGTSPAPTQQGETAAYLHALALANKTDGLFATYATEKGAKIHVVPSFKVLKGIFSFQNGLIRSSFQCRGSRVFDASAVITAMSSVTIPTNAHLRALASQAVFHLNAQNGADFAEGDIIKPKQFQLEIERTMEQDHHAGSRATNEPYDSDKPKVKLTLELPRMDTANDDYLGEWTAGTEKKADITITGAVISGSYAYYLKHQFPRLVIEDVEYADSKIIPCKVVLRGLEADAAPTGMTGVTNPIATTLMNTRVAGLLA